MEQSEVIAQQAADTGVSIIIRHKVLAANRSAYEAWLKKIIPAAANFPGHQSVHIMRPAQGGEQFEIAVRFASEALAHNWLNSAERIALVEEASQLFYEHEILEIYNGIDFWFSAPTAANKVATRWKQWLITTLIIWPLTYWVPRLMQPVYAQLSVPAEFGIQQFFSVVIIVGLVVYFFMPRVVKLVAAWLFK